MRYKLVKFFIFLIYFLLIIQLYFYKLPQKNLIQTSTVDLIRSSWKLQSYKIQRAILIFYPHNQEKQYLPEIRWLYHSWIEMINSGESNMWRTDLIIFTENLTLNFQTLHCIFNQTRLTKEEFPQCRIFPYIRISSRSLFYDEELRRYEYIDSINIIIEGYKVFHMYDYVLRTDIDVFLTKYFAFFLPISDMTVLVGRGAYSTVFNNNRLHRIANNMNWQYANMTNIGSTWYGPPHMIHEMANLTLEAMIHLNKNEFTIADKQRKFGKLQWPDWYYGVLSLYGAHLAINHLVLNKNFEIKIAAELLDQSTKNFRQNDIDKYKRLHLHCSHTHVPFSKFDFKKNKYDHIHPNSFINDTSPGAYAMRIALESKLMTLEELGQRFINAQKRKR